MYPPESQHPSLSGTKPPLERHGPFRTSILLSVCESEYCMYECIRYVVSKRAYQVLSAVFFLGVSKASPPQRCAVRRAQHQRDPVGNEPRPRACNSVASSTQYPKLYSGTALIDCVEYCVTTSTTVRTHPHPVIPSTNNKLRQPLLCCAGRRKLGSGR